MNSGIGGFPNSVGCETPAKAESRLQCGLNSLGAQSEQIASITERATRIANRICGIEPEKAPAEGKLQGPRPVETHMERMHRIGCETAALLERLTRQINRLEENVG